MSTITATLVPESLRMDFLPTFFGRHFMRGEPLVYAWMEKLCDEYDNATWNYYVLSNGSFYMAPEHDKPMKLSHSENYSNETVSADAAGIVATFFALNQLLNSIESGETQDALIERYYLLRDFIGTHPEREKINALID